MATSQGHRVCVLNIGLYRTGSTTLAAAAESLGWNAFREFPTIQSETMRKMLLDPSEAVVHWWRNCCGLETVLKLMSDYDWIGDGWISLLPFLPEQELIRLLALADKNGVNIVWIATTRSVDSYVHSELQHWVRHNLERIAGLSSDERSNLGVHLLSRFQEHASKLVALQTGGKFCIHMLPLTASIESSWPQSLALLKDTLSQQDWSQALVHVGKQNANPPLPLEGILVTLRLKDRKSLVSLLSDLEADPLYRAILVLALDHDEAFEREAIDLCQELRTRPRLAEFKMIVNPRYEGIFPICEVWDALAEIAWNNGASWVMLLGDDVRIPCSYHYRAFYRAFLDISEKLSCPFGFGCPWFNDTTFSGFPTFPVVGRIHQDIFGGLIPSMRKGSFVNQDLDPYLQRLYLKVGASPCLQDVELTNGHGGTDTRHARYDRVSAVGWRDWVLDDVSPLQSYLRASCSEFLKEPILVDVVIPSYRIDMEYLKRLTSVTVPDGLRTTFIVIIDNPELLKSVAAEIAGRDDNFSYSKAAMLLEKTLVNHSSTTTSGCVEGLRNNNIRVRCNEENLGASASRNRGIEESAAEYILFLDDDVIPQDDLLFAYERSLRHLIAKHDETEVLGVVGLVRFPRSPSLPLKHAAVLMSYLTFMFEIAANPIYANPAWGVTANILVRRLPQIRYDTSYAKTGGGEDVDFCLRLAHDGGRLRSDPSAAVSHPFWNGTPFELSCHFWKWAKGDSALFARFPHHCYRSWPNMVESSILLIPLLVAFCVPMHRLVLTLVSMVLADVIVDMSNLDEFRLRCRVLEYEHRSLPFLVTAHLLANLYVLVLESGRLFGHIQSGHFANIGRRFDWHCGRLKNASNIFAHKERTKFAAFVAIVVVCCWPSRQE